jgi:hypothetical protein
MQGIVAKIFRFLQEKRAYPLAPPVPSTPATLLSANIAKQVYTYNEVSSSPTS